MRQAIILLMAAAAECFAVDTVPVISWSVDCQAPAAFNPAAIASGETVIFQPQYKLNGRVLTLTNAVSAALQFRLSGETNAPYSLSGSIYNATNGQVRITWPSSNVVAAGAYDYKVLITGESAANLRAFGQLTVDAGFGSSTGIPPPYVTLVTSGTVAAVVAAHNADSNTSHGGMILSAYQWGTNAYNNATNALAQIAAHLVESWQTVHGGWIQAAYDNGTNALAIARQAFIWSDPTNGYVTASVTNGLVGVEVDPTALLTNGTRTMAAPLNFGGNVATNVSGIYFQDGNEVRFPVSIWEHWDAGGKIATLNSTMSTFWGKLVSTNLWGPSGSNVVTDAGYLDIGPTLQKAETATQPADLAALVSTSRTVTVNGQVGTLNSNVSFTVTGSTDAPTWIAATNAALSITLTNDLERPQYLYATGVVSVAFAGLRSPQPFYLVVRGPDSLTFPAGTHFIGGASWQTNQANHFIVWQYSTNLFVNPVTTSEE